MPSRRAAASPAAACSNPGEAGGVLLRARLEALEVGNTRGPREALADENALVRVEVGRREATFFRAAVIVTSSNAKSYFFGAGEKRPPNGERRNSTSGIFSCLAIASESECSKPDGFLIVVPDARPFQKPGAGRSKPTMSFPGSFVGGVPCAEAVTAATAQTPATPRSQSISRRPSLSVSGDPNLPRKQGLLQEIDPTWRSRVSFRRIVRP